MAMPAKTRLMFQTCCSPHCSGCSRYRAGVDLFGKHQGQDGHSHRVSDAGENRRERGGKDNPEDQRPAVSPRTLPASRSFGSTFRTPEYVFK